MSDETATPSADEPTPASEPPAEEAPPTGPIDRVFAWHLDRALAEMDLRFPTFALDHFKSYFEMLEEANRTVNLVADASPEVVAVKHVADSLLLLTTPALEGLEVRRAIDLGSGAGFPGLILALVQPETHWLLIESTGKKARFLEDCIFSLGLENVSVTQSRAEVLGHNVVSREEHQLVVARAVGHSAVLCELGLPFLEKGGRLVAYKSPDGERECQEAAHAAETCRGALRGIERATLPVEGAERLFCIWEKTGTTPDRYPRREGIPEKRPLMAPEGQST